MRFSTACLLVIFIITLFMLVKIVAAFIAGKFPITRSVMMFVYNIFDIPYAGLKMYNDYIRRDALGNINDTILDGVSGAYDYARQRFARQPSPSI